MYSARQFNNNVFALVFIGSDLYAGGDFTSPYSYLAKWNGTTWSALGTTGVNGNVYALTPISTTLYVGGKFTLAGATTVANIASWNGSAWAALGAGITGDNVNINNVPLESKTGKSLHISQNLFEPIPRACDFMRQHNAYPKCKGREY